MTPPTNAPPVNTRLRRSLRRFTCGSGPLKRGSDRVQLVGRLLVVLAFLLAPPLAIATANRTTTHLQAVAAGEAADRSRVHAVLLDDAPAAAPASDYYSGSATVTVRAVWSAPGRAARRGNVMVAPGTARGTAVPVWVDRRGRLTQAPLDPAGISEAAAAVGVLPLLGLPVVVWIAYALLSDALDGRRERRWAEDWAAVEPTWSSRRGELS